MSILRNTTRNVFTEAAQLMRDFPVLFGILWGGIFFVLFGVLAVTGMVPNVLTGDGDTVASAEVNEVAPVVLGPSTLVAQAAEADPVRIMIDAIGIDVTVLNPESQDIAVLDEALLEGAVRYPGSANLEEEGNVFLFGHSSYLPRVINPSFKAFNGIQRLESGDIIRARSRSDEYIYRVTSVKLVDANEAWVDLSRTGRKLTLSTCDSFGQKQDRFVVEAEFIGSYELSENPSGYLDF
ncbi:sortase [Candidatus Wolfebacteria bacterium]|nr:sortase [Candidatus Wolfebacteria bacterium]